MSNKYAYTRLVKELRAIEKDPPPHITTCPNPDNILEWYFVIQGAPKTVFEGGHYLGKITFPAQYPFKPPSLCMLTPSGRFEINRDLCLSMTNFHPETWNPQWSIGTILVGLQSFMVDNQQTTGSIQTSDSVKRVYACQSKSFNLKWPKFGKLFPDLKKQFEEELGVAAQNGNGAQRNDAPAEPELPNGTAPQHDRHNQAGLQRAEARPMTWEKMAFYVCVIAILCGLAVQALLSKTQ